MTVKSRAQTSSYVRRRLASGNPQSQDNEAVPYGTSAQVISSDGHPYHLIRKGSSRDIGGPFESRKIEVQLGGFTHPKWVRIPGTPETGAWRNEYFTFPLPHSDVSSALYGIVNNSTSQSKLQTWLGGEVPLGFSKSNLIALGAEAVDKMSPLNPVADVSTTLAEFFSERKFFNVPGNAGSAPGEYLNYQFGIAPTVGFAQDLRKAIQEKEEIVAQLARDSGRNVRRRGSVYEESNQTFETTTSGVYPAFLNNTPVTAALERGELTVTTRTYKRAWFSGAFTYYLPKEGILRSIRELDQKYGVTPGVNTAWELLPFSWLVDYRVSAGSAISNMRKFSQDGLVMRYGYIMGMSQTSTTYSWRGKLRDAGGALNTTLLSATVFKETKQRMAANPFGFGILPGDLSGRQLSILAALGMTYLK